MKVNIINRTISMVLIGSFRPVYMHANWLLDHGIITGDEYANHNEDFILPDLSKFSFSNFEIVCDKNRLQLLSTDISQVERMCDMIFSVVRCIPSLQIKALGINSDLSFIFQSAKDNMIFAKHFVNLSAFSGFMEDPHVRKFSVEDNNQPTAETPRRTIFIQSVDEVKLKEESVPVVRYSENSHFVVNNQEELNLALKKSSVTYEKFTETFEKIISAIQ